MGNAVSRRDRPPAPNQPADELAESFALGPTPSSSSLPYGRASSYGGVGGSRGREPSGIARAAREAKSARVRSLLEARLTDPDFQQ